MIPPAVNWRQDLQIPHARVKRSIIFPLIRGLEEAMRRGINEQILRKLIRRERIGVMRTGEVAETQRSTSRRGNLHQRLGANRLSTQMLPMVKILDCVLGKLFLLWTLPKPFRDQSQIPSPLINYLVKEDFLVKRVFLVKRDFLSVHRCLFQGLWDQRQGLRSMVTDWL